MRVLSFALQVDRGQLVLATVASLISGFASAALMGYIGNQFTSDDAIGPLSIATFLVLIVVALSSGITARWILVRLVGRRTHGMQMELARRLIATGLPRLESIGSARLFSVLTEDSRAVSEAMMRIPDLIIATALIVGCVAYLGWLSPLAVTGLAAVAIPIIWLYRRFHARVKRLMVEFFSLRDERYRQYQALTEGTKELQTDRQLWRRFLGRNLDVKGRRFWESQKSVIMAHEYANMWSQAAYFVFVFALLVMIRGDIVPNEILAAYALIALYIRTAMMQLTAAVPVWTQAGAALARIDGLGLAERGEDPGDGPTDGSQPESGRAPVGEPVSITAEGLGFRYPAGEDEDGTVDGYQFTLGPMDFELRSGEVVFITGGNGSGKTTLMKVLCSLYEPTSGTLACNGSAIDDAEARRDYRRRLSALFADGFTVEELIGIDDADGPGTDRANDFLRELDLTAKVQVVDGRFTTTKLSTGERKRLALLAAFGRDRPVYAFDEWAANQDPVFKRVFYRTLLPDLRRRGKLVIVISHDDGYFDEADRVLHLADGKLVDASVPADS